MNKALRILVAGLAAAVCAGLAPPEPSCSDEVLRRYEEVQQVAALNRQSAGPPPAANSFVPGATLIATTDAGFCRSRPRAVLCAGNRHTQNLTRAEVAAIDATLRAEFRYVSDEVQWSRTDWWTNDRTCGDCEDYALILSERLSSAGHQGRGMALVIWSPSPGLAHATLAVETSDQGAVEIGVGPSEVPRPMDWTRGQRAAYMRFDGSRNWYMFAR